MAHMAYRPSVDGLRALAILGVVAYHAGVPGVSGGYVGVDVFFVISGFLITQLLSQEIDATGKLSVARFYARRARRLLPALTVVIVTCLLLGLVLMPPGAARHELYASAVASALFVANQYFCNTTGGYFEGVSTLKPLLHLWSLAVEEQFYLLWPALLIVIAKCAPPARRRGWMRNVILVLTLASFALSVHLVGTHPAAAFYVSPARAWELGVGAYLALREEAVRGSVAASHWALRLGVAAVLASMLLLEPGTRFPGAAAVPAVLGTALIIWGDAHAGPNLISRVFSSAPAVALGLVSYGWYLWHWPLLAFARRARLMEPDPLADALCVILALILATLMLHLIESPIRFGAAARRLRTRTVLLGAAGSIGAMLALATLGLHTELALSGERDRLAARALADTPDAAHLRCLIEPVAGSGSQPACRFGAAGAPVQLLVWGDSHAAFWTPLVTALQQDGRPAFVQLTQSGCRPLAPAAQDRNDAPCVAFRRRVLQALPQLKDEGLRGVILAGRWPPLIDAVPPLATRPEPHTGVRDVLRWLRGSAAPVHPPIDTGVLAADLRLTFQALDAAGLRTLVLLDPPEFRYPVPDCLYFRPARPGACDLPRAGADDAARIAAVFRDVAAADPRVRVFDPLAYFCDARACPARRPGGFATMIDEDHVSASAAIGLAPQLRQDLAWLLAP